MRILQVLLATMLLIVIVYTSFVGLEHGWHFFPTFFGDIMAFTWPGQFNLDFSMYLFLSGLWVAWRHQFTPGGIALGILALFGGILVLMPYLLYMSFTSNGDIKELLLGNSGAA